MRFFDTHTHILPGIDDGAKNKEESQKMIEMLKNQGITDVIFTPHFYNYETTLDKFVQKRDTAFEQIKDSLGDIKAHMGAEVYLVDTLFGIDDISELCIDKSNYILVELPFNEHNQEKILSMLNRLCVTFQVIPILAHLEKYHSFFNSDFLHEISKIECLVQIDIDSLKHPFLRKKINKFIERGYIQFVGSDCHNLKERKPNFDVLEKNLPALMCEFLHNNSDITF